MELLTTIIYTTHFSPKEMNTIVTDTIFYPFVFTTSKSFYSLPKARKEYAVYKKYLACTHHCLIFLFVCFGNIGERSSEAGEREKEKIFFPYLYPFARAVNKSPAVFIFYPARLTDFEEKIEGL